MTDEEIIELILRRRRQIIINSCMYYRFGKAIITDKQFDKWAYELADLQNIYPELAKKCVEFNDDFEDWDGTTGYHLQMYGEWVTGRTEQIIEYAEKKGLLL